MSEAATLVSTPGARRRWQDALARTRMLREPLAKALGAVTPLGWLALAMGVVCLPLGLVHHWREFVALGGVCLLLFDTAPLWLFGSSAFRARVELDSRRAHIGDQALGRVIVATQNRRELLPPTLELRVGAGLHAFVVPPIKPGEEHEVLFAVPTRRRAVIPVGPLRSVRHDPLDLMRRVRTWTDVEDLYVHPDIVVLSAASAGFLKDTEGVIIPELSSSDVAFHALREYVPGDDRRSIHWRTTARTGKLMVRQFEETRRSHLGIFLSTSPGSYDTPVEFEDAISAAGSLAMQAIREDRQVSILTDDGPLRFRGGAVLLDRLTELELAETSITMAELVRRGTQQVPDISIAALLSGTKADPNALRLAQQGLSLDVFSFAIRMGAEKTARHKVSVMTIIDVPTLKQLPSAIRSVR